MEDFIYSTQFEDYGLMIIIIILVVWGICEILVRIFRNQNKPMQGRKARGEESAIDRLRDRYILHLMKKEEKKKYNI